MEPIESRLLLNGSTILAGTVSGNVGNGQETHSVDIIRHGPAAIIETNPDQQTWIVIHGRSSSRFSAPVPNIPRLASAILARRPADQVLTLDWSGPARPQSGLLFLEEDWIEPVATWAAGALLGAGFAAGAINLVGHSWGANLADELAERLGGVNTIVALDPAKNGSGAYNPNAGFGTPSAEINFAAHSDFSWAFYSRDGGTFGITAGNEITATSADEALVVTASEHSRVVNLFSFMLENPTLPVPRFFKISRLLNHRAGPWLANRYDHRAAAGNAYEAVIVALSGGESPSSLTSIRGDFTPPAINSSSFEFQNRPRQLLIDFSEDVFDTLGLGDVTIQNLATGAQFNPVALRYDAATDTALFDLPSQLTDANYTATLARDSAADLVGNTLSADQTIDFFMLTGDLNYDRQVSIADFITLASNLNTTSATWSDGDINGDGLVSIADFIDLSSHFGETLAEPGSPMATLSTVTLAELKAASRRPHHRSCFLTAHARRRTISANAKSG